MAKNTREKTQNNQNIIIVENLNKCFKNFCAVNDTHFSVKRGEIFALLGPNGAGKTTTIKMLTTLLPPTHGNATLNGFSIFKEKDNVRNSIGIVFQDQSLDDELTAYENMYFHCALYRVPRRERKGRIERMLKFVELFDKRDEFVKTYSGGMKRRLEIARALLHEPKVMFLDEPTQGLDPQTRKNIWEYIQNLSRKNKMTVFFTTHYIEEAQKYAETVAIMDKGKIIKIGSPIELMKSTKTKSVEDAFLKLTGSSIREEGANAIEEMRMRRRVWNR